MTAVPATITISLDQDSIDHLVAAVIRALQARSRAATSINVTVPAKPTDELLKRESEAALKRVILKDRERRARAAHDPHRAHLDMVADTPTGEGDHPRLAGDGEQVEQVPIRDSHDVADLDVDAPAADDVRHDDSPSVVGGEAASVGVTDPAGSVSSPAGDGGAS